MCAFLQGHRQKLSPVAKRRLIKRQRVCGEGTVCSAAKQRYLHSGCVVAGVYEAGDGAGRLRRQALEIAGCKCTVNGNDLTYDTVLTRGDALGCDDIQKLLGTGRRLEHVWPLYIQAGKNVIQPLLRDAVTALAAYGTA